MQWYVLQTRTGEEEKLVEMIRRIVPRHLYGECFVIYHEQLWRRQQKNLVQVRRAFPGYVFITSREPGALFFCLKQLPAMVKMMARDDDFFLPVEAEEEAFLKKIMDVNHVIGLSYLKTDGKGNVLSVTGANEILHFPNGTLSVWKALCSCANAVSGEGKGDFFWNCLKRGFERGTLVRKGGSADSGAGKVSFI